MDIQHAHRLAHGRSLGEADQISQADLVQARTGTSYVIRGTDNAIGYSRGHSKQPALDSSIERPERFRTPNAKSSTHSPTRARPARFICQRRFEARKKVEAGSTLGGRILAAMDPGILAAPETANQVATASQECQPRRSSLSYG